MIQRFSNSIRCGLVYAACLFVAGCGQSDDPATARGATQDPPEQSSGDDAADTPVDDGMPQISGTPPATVVVDGTYSFTPTAMDADGDPLEFSVVDAPGWAEFDPASGALTGVPGPEDVGTSAGIEISVSDGANVASLAPFSIEVLQMADGQAMLQWDAPVENADDSPLTDLAGYRVYYGRASGDYDQIAEVENPGVSRYLVENLAPGPWYFAVAALDASDRESELSNEATALIE